MAQSFFKSFRASLLGRFFHPDAQTALDHAWQDMANNRDDADAQAVLKDLRLITSAWADKPDGLTDMRTELMDSVDRSLVHHALAELDADSAQAVLNRMPALPGSTSDLKRLIEASELRVAVIRHWADIYYNDCAEGDWFDTYCRAAQMRKSSAIRDLERLAGDVPTATHNNIDAAIRGLNTSLRLRLLQAPRGKKIGQLSLRSRLRAFFGADSSEQVEEGAESSPSSST